MERSVCIVGEFGIPYEQIVQQIERRYSVGTTFLLNANDSVMLQGALRKDIAKGLLHSRKSYDIQALLCGYTYPDILSVLDATEADIKVVYCIGNLYWRFRVALSWGVLIEDFVNYEHVKVYQDILKARADAIIDLDKVIKPTSPLELPDLLSLIERALSKADIHSSQVRN